MGIGAGIFCAAVLEYLACKILELAGNITEDHRKKMIALRPLKLVIRNEDELNKVMATSGYKKGKSGAKTGTDDNQEKKSIIPTIYNLWKSDL